MLKNLRELREHRGYSFFGVLRITGIDHARLLELERNHATISVWEADELGTLYGVEPDDLAEDPPNAA